MIAPEIDSAVRNWLAHLAGERRLAAGTLEVYGRDTRQFLEKKRITLSSFYYIPAYQRERRVVTTALPQQYLRLV